MLSQNITKLACPELAYTQESGHMDEQPQNVTFSLLSGQLYKIPPTDGFMQAIRQVGCTTLKSIVLSPVVSNRNKSDRRSVNHTTCKPVAVRETDVCTYCSTFTDIGFHCTYIVLCTLHCLIKYLSMLNINFVMILIYVFNHVDCYGI